jgi:hypothetical protein
LESSIVEDSQGVLARFIRLMRDLENGASTRHCFRPWEVELLLDFETCDLGTTNKQRVLRRYRRAVQRRLEKGVPIPLKLSEYLVSSRNLDTRPAEDRDERIPGAA